MRIAIDVGGEPPLLQVSHVTLKVPLEAIDVVEHDEELASSTHAENKSAFQHHVGYKVTVKVTILIHLMIHLLMYIVLNLFQLSRYLKAKKIQLIY